MTSGASVDAARPELTSTGTESRLPIPRPSRRFLGFESEVVFPVEPPLSPAFAYEPIVSADFFFAPGISIPFAVTTERASASEGVIPRQEHTVNLDA